MHHKLKIAPPYYAAVRCGDKNFEIRMDCCGFQKGDTIEMREYEMGNIFHSDPIKATITYVTAFQQKDGWVVFGFRIDECAKQEEINR